MGSVFIRATVFLDGFIAGPENEVDWSLQFGSDEMAAHPMQAIGAVVGASAGFRRGWMDDRMLHRVPIILRDRNRLFDRLEPGRIMLGRTQLATTEQITSLQFRVVSQPRAAS